MQLRIRQPDGQQRLVPLRQEQPLRLGGDPAVDVPLVGTGLLPVHCGVLFREGQFRVFASKVAGQVEVNGTLVPTAPLEEGDQFRLGDVLVAVVSDSVTLKPTVAAPSSGKPSAPAVVAKPPPPQPVAPSAASVPAAADEEIQLAGPDDDPLLAPSPPQPTGVRPQASPSKPKPQDDLDEMHFLDDPHDEASLEAVPLDDIAELAAAPPENADSLELLEEADGLEAVDDGAGGFDVPGLELAGLEDASGLDGGDMLGGELGAALPAGGAAGMGLGAGLLAGAAVPAAAPAAAAPQPAAPTAPRPPSKLGLVLKVIAALLFIGPAIAVVVVLIARQPTAAERFQQADELYQSGAALQAVEALDAFLQTYPNDSRADEMRVKRVLVLARPQVTGGGDRAAALAALQDAVTALGPLSRHPVAERSWTEWGPKVASALHERAKAAAGQPDAARAETALAQAQEALDWVRRHVPPSAQSAQGIDDLEVQVAALSRSQKQALALSSTLTAIRQSLGEKQPAGAYAARDRLLADYPAMSTNTSLQETLASSAEVELQRVQTSSNGPEASKEAPDEFFLLRGVCASGTAAESQERAAGVVGLLDQAHGTVFAVDTATGQVLWRRFVGYEADSPPVMLPGDPPGMLLLDSARTELWRVDARSGRLVWRQSLSGPSLPPVVLGEFAFIAERSGLLWQVDLRSGAIAARYEFPLPLQVPPVVDAGTQRVFQLAGQAQLFVISAAERKCLAAYVGHEPGSVVWPPVLIGSHLVLIERDGLRDTRLQLWDVKAAPRRVDALPLRGSIVSQPVAGDEAIFLATDDGLIQSVELTAGEQKRALRRGPSWTSPTDAEATVHHLSVTGGRLWSAGRGLRSWPLPWRDQAPASQEAAPTSEQFVRPLITAGGTNITVRRQGAGLGVAPLSASPLWDTLLGAAPAAGPVLDAAGNNIWLLLPGGDLFRIDVESDSPANRQLTAIARAPGESTPHGSLAAVGKHVAAGLSGGHSIVLATADGAESRTVPLPGPLAGIAPGPDGPLLVALQSGAVVLIDVEPGTLLGEPLLPAWKPDQVVNVTAWSPLPGGRIALSLQNRLLIATTESRPAIRPVIQQEVELSISLTGSLASAAGAVWGVDEQRRAVGWNIEGLSPIGEIALGAEAVWGPARAGEMVLLATTDGRLMRLGPQSTPLWETAEVHGLVTGAVMIDGQRLLVATRGGDLLLLSADSGQSLSPPLKTHQPLSGNPLVVGDRLFVATADGCLLQLRQPLQSMIGGATAAVTPKSE